MPERTFVDFCCGLDLLGDYAESESAFLAGADRIGTPNDYGVRSALAKLGLKPEIDVQLLRLGGSAIQWTALQSRQIAASALTPPVSLNADAQGYTRLADTYDLPYQNIGVVIRKTEVEKRAETWLRLLRGVQRGISVWYDDPQLSKSVLAKYTRDKNAGTLEKTYGFFTKHWLPSRPHLYRSRLRTILRFFGSTARGEGCFANSVLRYQNHRQAEKITGAKLTISSRAGLPTSPRFQAHARSAERQETLRSKDWTWTILRHCASYT